MTGLKVDHFGKIIFLNIMGEDRVVVLICESDHECKKSVILKTPTDSETFAHINNDRSSQKCIQIVKLQCDIYQENAGLITPNIY